MALPRRAAREKTLQPSNAQRSRGSRGPCQVWKVLALRSFERASTHTIYVGPASLHEPPNTAAEKALQLQRPGLRSAATTSTLHHSPTCQYPRCSSIALHPATDPGPVMLPLQQDEPVMQVKTVAASHDLDPCKPLKIEPDHEGIEVPAKASMPHPNRISNGKPRENQQPLPCLARGELQ